MYCIKILWYETSARICDAIMFDTNLASTPFVQGVHVVWLFKLHLTELNVYSNFCTNQQTTNVTYRTKSS